ncbi:c-type cytochrome [Cupriavidus basilensis]|uniref:Cytochrome c4 n=1 Tax=Cupriavidus basilensis TaxID=68895 RepID=A0A0C4YK75_9BURK|nr:c-type cytochrome [Cupriavidus basilensis]AJG22374.1 Cytochrome c4 [Cupriavidus basilensis]
MTNTKTKSRGRGKRILVLGGALLLAAVVVGGVMYGPELYGLLQFGKQLDQITQEDTRVGGPWPRASEACVSCHGYGGNARAQTYPRLAGQPEAYLKKQLTAFASGERSNPTMTSLAVSMSQRELDGLAAHFSKMTPLPNTTFQADPARVARGEALVKANNCAACHGQQLEGKDLYPRLAGQGYGYLRDQLTSFKSGARRDATGSMPVVARALSQQDIDDLAQYIASR